MDRIIDFTVIGEHGQVLHSGTSTADLSEIPGPLVIEGLAPPNHWWDGTQYVPIVPQPDMFHVYDWPTHQWRDARDLEAWKTLKWGEIKTAREAFIAGGVDVGDLGRFDADQDAAVHITAVYTVLDAQPADWTVEWTRFDNTAIVLTKEQFRGVAMAVLGHSLTAHGIGRELRDRLSAAASVGEVIGVRWPS